MNKPDDKGEEFLRSLLYGNSKDELARFREFKLWQSRMRLLFITLEDVGMGRISFLLYTRTKRIVRAWTVAKEAREPPTWAEYLIWLCVPRDERDAILGDVRQHYPYWRRKFGPFWSQLLIVTMVIRSVPYFAWAAIHTLVIKRLIGW